jgi:hypothetical protein
MSIELAHQFSVPLRDSMERAVAQLDVAVDAGRWPVPADHQRADQIRTVFTGFRGRPDAWRGPPPHGPCPNAPR